MKKTISILFAVLFLGLCLIPSVGLALTGGSGAAAHQVLAARPSLTNKDGALDPDYLEKLSDYVNDRFSLRQEAVTLWARLNAKLLRSVLDGTERGPYRAAAVENAAAVIIVGGKTSNYREALDMARESIDSGRAAAKLEALVRLSNGQ